jgi:hypothetical protein
MPPLRKAGLMALAFFALTFGGALTARADVIVMLNTNAGGSPVNLNDSAGAATVTGTTAAGNTVNFTGTTSDNVNTLEAEAGAAIISAPGNNNGDANITSLSYSLANNQSFTSTQFNVDATATGLLQLTVTGVGLDYTDVANDGVNFVSNNGTTLVLTFDAGSAGSNITNILAINGQLLTGITISAVGNTEINLIRQIRIDGDGPITNPVPEPMTMVLFGTGLAGIAAKVRRRRKAAKLD